MLKSIVHFECSRMVHCCYKNLDAPRGALDVFLRGQNATICEVVREERNMTS
jgi:hypothetical protein